LPALGALGALPALGALLALGAAAMPEEAGLALGISTEADVGA
jgi:hypothetical protein